MLQMTAAGWQSAIEQFVEEGYGIVPFPFGEALPDLLEQFEHFLERHLHKPYFELLGWTPSEEDSVDSGFYHKGTAGELDFKGIFHFKKDVDMRMLALEKQHPEITWSEADLQLFARSHRFWQELQDVVLSFAAELDAMEQYNVPFLPLLLRAIRYPEAYANNVLRLLHYTAQDKPAGATVHPDRSCLTAHPGGLGGGLFWTDTLDGEPRGDIEPALGELAIFPGVKAQIMTRQAELAGCPGETLSALLHGSETNPGEARSAAVFFAHCHTQKSVVSAKRAYEHTDNYVR